MQVLTIFMVIYANEDTFKVKIIIFNKIQYETLKSNSIKRATNNTIRVFFEFFPIPDPQNEV